MTIREAQRLVGAMGFTLRKDGNTFRLNLKGASEESAYYTDDLDDAVDTANAWAMRRSSHREAGKKGRAPSPVAYKDATISMQSFLTNEAAKRSDTADQFDKDGMPKWADRARAEAAILSWLAINTPWEAWQTNPPDVHIDIGSHNAHNGNAFASNPPILIASNPAELIGVDVHRIYYVHATEGARVHKFTSGNVIMEGLEDGSLHIYHPSLRLWGDK